MNNQFHSVPYSLWSSAVTIYSLHIRTLGLCCFSPMAEKSKSTIIIKATTIEFHRNKDNFDEICLWAYEELKTKNWNWRPLSLLHFSRIHFCSSENPLRTKWADRQRTMVFFCRNSNGNGASIKHHIEHMIIPMMVLLKKTSLKLRVDNAGKKTFH